MCKSKDWPFNAKHYVECLGLGIALRGSWAIYNFCLFNQKALSIIISNVELHYSIVLYYNQKAKGKAFYIKGFTY